MEMIKTNRKQNPFCSILSPFSVFFFLSSFSAVSIYGIIPPHDFFLHLSSEICE
jgi:hypothetical protein